MPDVANVERYAQIVKEKSMLRRLIVMGNSVMRAALDAPSEPGDVLTIAEKSLYEIAEGTTDKGFVSLGAITRTNMAAIEQIHSNAGRLVTGLPTGYDRFNEMTSGLPAAGSDHPRRETLDGESSAARFESAHAPRVGMHGLSARRRRACVHRWR